MVRVRPAIFCLSNESHHRVYRSQNQQRDRKRNMHQEPRMQPTIDAHLAAQLVLLFADVFEIVQQRMHRSNQ